MVAFPALARLRREPRGKLVASVLAGAWRRSPPPLTLSPVALAEITPLLLRTGGASLGWWRVRYSELRTCSAAFQLQQAYRFHTLQAARQKRQLIRAVTLFASVGVEPLLAKGWAAARLYPEPGLRPYGDIDLWVRPGQHAVAAAALRSAAGQNSQVDLHKKFRHLDRSWNELYDRSRLVPLGEMEIRTLGPEDHLRLLCLHMLYHGLWRPLWLCDIAAALEFPPAEFDWEYCLSGNARYSEWVASAIGLAHQLLGARLDGIPGASRLRRLPRWLPSSVLRQWGADEHYMYTPPMTLCLRSPLQTLKALRLRWPNAIQATVGVGGPFNHLPRFPFQFAECLLRTVHFVARVALRFRRHSTQAVVMQK